MNEKKYNEAAFPDRFSAYKDTIELAKLGESDKNGSEEEVQDTLQLPTKTRPRSAAQGSQADRRRADRAHA